MHINRPRAVGLVAKRALGQVRSLGVGDVLLGIGKGHAGTGHFALPRLAAV